jgi:hypothetical protein
MVLSVLYVISTINFRIWVIRFHTLLTMLSSF